MNTAKIYYDSKGNMKNIRQMVKEEPDWAANRIQTGEDAIAELKELKAQQPQGDVEILQTIGFSERDIQKALAFSVRHEMSIRALLRHGLRLLQSNMEPNKLGSCKACGIDFQDYLEMDMELSGDGT